MKQKAERVERVECDWKADGRWMNLNHVKATEVPGTFTDIDKRLLCFGWLLGEGPAVWKVGDKRKGKGLLTTFSLEAPREKIHDLKSGTFQFEADYMGNLIQVRLRWKK